MAKSLKEQLTKIGIKSAHFSNNKTLPEVMASEAKRLYRCIQKYINRYYRKYSPSVYERTDGYQNGLYAEDIAQIRIVDNTLRIGVGFKNDLAMHPNLDTVYWNYGYFGNEDNYVEIPIIGQHESFVPILMEKGWHARRLENILGQSVPRLTYFDGIHAVEDGIDEFNKTNKYGIIIDDKDFFKSKAY